MLWNHVYSRKYRFYTKRFIQNRFWSADNAIADGSNPEMLKTCSTEISSSATQIFVVDPDYGTKSGLIPYQAQNISTATAFSIYWYCRHQEGILIKSVHSARSVYSLNESWHKVLNPNPNVDQLLQKSGNSWGQSKFQSDVTSFTLLKHSSIKQQ